MPKAGDPIDEKAQRHRSDAEIKAIIDMNVTELFSVGQREGMQESIGENEAFFGTAGQEEKKAEKPENVRKRKASIMDEGYIGGGAKPIQSRVYSMGDKTVAKKANATNEEKEQDAKTKRYAGRTRIAAGSALNKYSEHPNKKLMKRGMRVMYDSPSAGKLIDAIVRNVHRDGRIDLNIRVNADPKRIRVIKVFQNAAGASRETSSHQGWESLLKIFPPDPEMQRAQAEAERARREIIV
eukprot:CAMPEP_0197533608 /NCGR_PEP_ID=MMETSP1318-20131121/44070_1 /TAXON_ID=552666 /ORGANISM="Partenskyella glossopodia, Strain RCC365" /LENGTH=238 /DNA_ID=CAMNT_0043090561 /DNA_START=72 /DNA_END=788 /DNA_ORIENTATION=+